MIRLILICLFVCGVFDVIAQNRSSAIAPEFENINADSRGYLVKVGDRAPDDFFLVFSSGDSTTLKKMRGKIVVLQFTASWCKVCREEMPHLETELWQVYKDRNVRLIGIDRNEPLETVLKFGKELKISYPLALDPGASIFGRFADKKAGVTRNVVIDKNGRIVFLTRLYNKEEFSAMLKVIEGLIKQN